MCVCVNLYSFLRNLKSIFSKIKIICRTINYYSNYIQLNLFKIHLFLYLYFQNLIEKSLKVTICLHLFLLVYIFQAQKTFFNKL